MQIFDIIAMPLGFILSFIYSLVKSYGLAIIIFTIIIKLVLLPLSVKQMKSQQEIARLQPKLREIEKKYKGDKAKVQEETMKLYKEEGVSMTGGCLPLLIQLPIIFGLYQVIYRPLAFLIGLPEATITKLREIYGLASGASEIEIASLMQANPQLAKGIVDNVKTIDFNFLGINLAKIPSINFAGIQQFFASIDVLWLIPLLSLLTAILSAWVSKKYMPATPAANSAQEEQTKRMTNSMLFVMPLMSLYFAFILPAGVGVYWIISNILAAVQQFALFKYIKPLPPIPLDDNIVEKRPVNKDQGSYMPRPKDQKNKIKPQNSTGQKAHTQKPEMQRTQGQPGQQGQRPAGQRPPGQRPPNTSAKKNVDQSKKGE